MAEPRDVNSPQVAKVDHLVDENGSRIDVPDGSGIKVAGEHDATVASTGPTNWWLYGLIALAIIIAVLLIMQMFSGAPGTDMQPGTPTSEPVVESIEDPAPATDAAPAAEPAPAAPATETAPAAPAVDAAPATPAQ